MELIELISNTDDFLVQLVETNLMLTYFILFVIIFSESGIILCPFLPGDGLLFSIGVIAAITPLSIYIVIPLLIFAAIVGYLFNYQMGRIFGEWIMQKDIAFVNKAYGKTNIFIAKNGSRAIVLSRFFPIVRTYLPFVAGAVNMNYSTFLRQTILGSFIWVCLFILSGFFLGEIPWVKENYGVIFLGLIILTLTPFIIQLLRTLFKKIKH